MLANALGMLVAGIQLVQMPAAEQGLGQQPDAKARPALRWYDARARVALRCVADWLHVPWRKVVLPSYLLGPRLHTKHGGPSASHCRCSRGPCYQLVWLAPTCLPAHTHATTSVSCYAAAAEHANGLPFPPM